jgi:hypothetical protein
MTFSFGFSTAKIKAISERDKNDYSQCNPLSQGYLQKNLKKIKKPPPGRF